MTAVQDHEHDNEWLPDRCPPWCQQTHAQCLAEGNGWEDAQEHHWGGYGDTLQEIRNCIDHRVTRKGGGGWDLSLRQRPMQNGGLLDEATVLMGVRDAGYKGVVLNLTSGEARSLARQLVALADRLDLPAYPARHLVR